MLSGGVRLALVVAVPLLGALLVHELGARRRAALVAALGAIAGTAALALSIAASLPPGGSVERTFGTAVPGIDLTVRGDSASIAVTLIAALAAAAALSRARHHPGRLAGLLLALAGTATVATAGTLVQIAAGVQIIGVAALLSGGAGKGRVPGGRTAVVLTVVSGAAALGLATAAVQLIAQAGSSDLAFVPASAIDAAVAVPWALAGALLLAAPALLGGASAGWDAWPAIAAAPAAFMVLLRLQDAVDGPLPAAAGLSLVAVGALAAAAAAWSALRSTTVAGAGRAALGVLTGLLISEFAGELARDGTVLAGLFMGLELAWLAAPAWTRRPGAWAVVSAALVAVPGGATAAVTVLAVGGLAAGGVSRFPQLAVLSGALAAASIAVGRRLQAPPRGGRSLGPGTGLAVAAGILGGLAPGLALRDLTPALAGGGQRVDIDAGALQVPGASWAGGYLSVAVVFMVVAAVAALLVVSDAPIAGVVPAAPDNSPPPRITRLLRLRRLIRRHQRRVVEGIRSSDRWLEAQPQVTMVIVAAAAAIVVLR